MTHKLLNLFAISVVISCTGCVTIFSPKYQNVKFTSATPGATILYKGDSVGVGSAKIKLDKRKKYQTILVEKPGFVSRSFEVQTRKASPVMPLIILDIYPTALQYDLYNPKTRVFDKEYRVPELTPFAMRKDDEKFIVVDKTAIKVKSNDVAYEKYVRLQSYYKKSADWKKTNKGKSLSSDDIAIENTIFSDGLTEKLTASGFTDSTQKLFGDKNNTLYISSTIKKIRFHNIVYRFLLPNPTYQLVSAEMDIEWAVNDYYGETIWKSETHKVSDLVTVAVDEEARNDGKGPGASVAIREAIANGLEKSLADVCGNLRKNNLLSVGVATDTSAFISINRPAVEAPEKVSSIMKSGVTIKTDKGHGSGVIIAANGYVVTNYHVVSGAKTIEVILNDGTKYNGTVERKNTSADLALVKVEATGLSPLNISEVHEPEMGVEVWTIGTPVSVELGQSVSKGIISGIRNNSGISYLQTDATFSPGSSGGALVSKKGEVLGITTSKLVGKGAEGIGFAIAGWQILSQLHLKYN